MKDSPLPFPFPMHHQLKPIFPSRSSSPSLSLLPFILPLFLFFLLFLLFLRYLCFSLLKNGTSHPQHSHTQTLSLLFPFPNNTPPPQLYSPFPLFSLPPSLAFPCTLPPTILPQILLTLSLTLFPSSPPFFLFPTLSISSRRERNGGRTGRTWRREPRRERTRRRKMKTRRGRGRGGRMRERESRREVKKGL